MSLTAEDIFRRDQSQMGEVYENITKYFNATHGPGMGQLSEITQNLYISNIEIALDIEKLKNIKISAIVYLGIDKKSDEILEKYKKKKISHIQIKIDDDPRIDIMTHLEPCYKFIHKFIQDEKKVLIHCTAGVSRSPTVLAYYLLKRFYLTNSDKESKVSSLLSWEKYHIFNILKLIKECRPCIRPNPGFIKQLLITEYQIKQYMTKILGEKYPPKIVEKEKDEDDESQSESESNDENNENDENNDENDDGNNYNKHKPQSQKGKNQKEKKLKEKDTKLKNQKEKNNTKFDSLEDLEEIAPYEAADDD